MPLRDLTSLDKAACLKLLETATDAQAWDAFLEGQANLFFDSEISWIAQGPWWQKANHILEIGSGNGAYLHRLSSRFPDKAFKGIEKLSSSVSQAQDQYARQNVLFEQGDAEVFDGRLARSSDIVFFRLTLQHLKDGTAALKHASTYLKPSGHVVIIDSYDMAKKTSHPIVAIDDALKLVAEVQKHQGKGNRQKSMELMQSIENKTSELHTLYKVVFSNLDGQGNVVGQSVHFEGKQSRLRYFTHSLLFLTLLHRTYHVPIDVNRAYDELKEYLNDDNAWTAPGMHFLVLKVES